jgi:hypothetical protein
MGNCCSYEGIQKPSANLSAQITPNVCSALTESYSHELLPPIVEENMELDKGYEEISDEQGNLSLFFIDFLIQF